MKKSHALTSQQRAAQRQFEFSRRQFLQGVGACMALPFLESALSPALRAASAAPAVGGLGVTPSGAPMRMAFVTFPNGAHQGAWWPAAGEGADFTLGATMQPLASLQKSIQVIGGLDHKNAAPGNDGAGDHARANATFLTGMRARKTDSTDIEVGISIDQAVAQKIGHLTRFSSLELTCDDVRKAGRCDSGYSCAYLYNISWASPSTPMTPEPNPRLVFERLFGAGAPGERQKNFEQTQASQRSLLDVVMDDAKSLQRRLGRRDQDKLEEYLTGVREIEQRIERSQQFGKLPTVEADAPKDMPRESNPMIYGERMNLMFDLMALAFETDSTRVATLVLAGDGTNATFPQIGIPEGHHYCTHHRNQKELMDKVARIDLYYMEHFARFLKRLDEKKDVDGRSILQNSMIVYGCGNSDGNRHTHDNLPVVLAGGGGGTLQTGRFSKLGGQPMSNLFLSMADRMGVKGMERFGDSSGRVTVV
jgi:hypothetical protein